MGLKYQGDSTLGVSLTMQTPKPLDTRLVVDTREDLFSIPEKYAYLGMPVVCVADGNIYTLVDKNKITETSGWKASYESIQILTCTEAEYNEWKANTNTDYTPIDGTKTWLHQDTYYYIYEESIEDKGQYYVSQSQFEDLTNQVNKKATITSLNSLSSKITEELTNYATLKDIDSSDPESSISKTLNETLDNYYTKETTDDKFVTKESLRGDNVEGDDFIFVTQTQYTKDQESLKTYQEETLKKLSNKIDTDSDASLNSLQVATITNEENVLSIGQSITINNETLALDKNVPKIKVMDQQEYEALETKDPDTYYMTHGTEEDNSGMVTSSFLEENYYNQLQTIQLLKDIIKQLCEDNNLTYNVFNTIEVDKPTNQSFVYDGEVHTLESNDFYNVAGTGGSEVGTYRFKVILKGGKWWTDGTRTPIFVTYTIQ